MRLPLIAWILAALMGGVAIAGYVGQAAPNTPPVHDARWYAATGTFKCEGRQYVPTIPPNVGFIWEPIPDAIRAGQIVCKYPDEATFREARAKAVAGPEAELRRALDRVAMASRKRDAILDGTDADARGLSPAQREIAVIPYQDIANFRVQQQLLSRKQLSQVEAAFDETYPILQAHWAPMSEPAPSLITRIGRMLHALERGAELP